MNVIVCLDDNGGMMFNRRRQSRDRVLRKRIISMSCDSGQRLLMNEYTYKQFADDVDAGSVTVAEDFLSKALTGEFCFAEDRELKPFEDKIEKLIVYRWNRKYPADVRFDLDLTSWNQVSTEEFAGSSHEKITEEIYIKAGQ